MSLTSCALVALLLAANTSCERNPPQQNFPDKEALIERNIARVKRESDLLDEWIKRRGLQMESTATGLHYSIYGSSIESQTRLDTLRPHFGQRVGVRYTAFLLDSTKVEDTGRETYYFSIGHDNVISGIHEAVTLLQPGDSAHFIVPSYLAYGLTGKSPLIPSNAPLFYDLTLVEIQ